MKIKEIRPNKRKKIFKTFPMLVIVNSDNEIRSNFLTLTTNGSIFYKKFYRSYDDAIIIILNLTLLFYVPEAVTQPWWYKRSVWKFGAIFFYFIILCLAKNQDLHNAKLDTVKQFYRQSIVVTNIRCDELYQNTDYFTLQ